MIESIKLIEGSYILSRIGDNAGDSGSLVVSIDYDNNFHHYEIKLDCCVRVGSHIARTMQWQDYWTTTPVTEILEVSPDNTYVKFKTRNSVYKLTKI